MLSNRLPPELDADVLHAPQLPPGHADLSCGNPTICGLHPSAVELPPRPLDWQAPYRPDPLGAPQAREALAAALTQVGRPCAAEALVLCASTSEAFAALFKLVANPGAAVAFNVPGYPLAQHLAELEGLRPLPFASRLHAGAWRLDFASLDTALAAGAKVVVLVSPNNPTGACMHPDDAAPLAARCNAAAALVIFDEVFAPYGVDEQAPYVWAPLAAFARAASLGGLSKAACLPQAKLSWIHLHGDKDFVQAARIGLSWIGDAALSLGGPVQAVLPDILAAMPAVQARVRARLRQNAQALAQLLAGRGTQAAWAQALPRQGGWYALVRLQDQIFADFTPPNAPHDAAFARVDWLAARACVQLQSAKLFDVDVALQGARFAVVTSLITPPQTFVAGWSRLAAIARKSY